MADMCRGLEECGCWALIPAMAYRIDLEALDRRCEDIDVGKYGGRES